MDRTRSSRRGGGRGKQGHHIDETSSLTVNNGDLQHLESSSSNTSTSQPQRSTNPRWIPRNRHAHVPKSRFVKKSQLGSVNEQMGSLRIGEPEKHERKNVEEEEEERIGFGNGSIGETSAEVAKSRNWEEEAVCRLVELELSAESQPELSDQQLRINDQAQEDELLAMESIFGENFYVFERERGLRFFQIRIHIEASGDIIVSTKLNSSGDLKTTNSNSNDLKTTSISADEFSYSFTVQHLPPIILTCLLPKSYPSHQPPYFTISAIWLDCIKISDLCSKLDSLWMEQQGQEVIYQWVEWLQSSSLSHLGFDKEIVLGPYGIRDAGNRRAVTGSVSPESDIPFIRSYDNDRLYENFLNSLHDCYICFSEYAGTEFIRLSCQHFFCRKCMKTYSDMHVKEGTITKLLCPDAKCGGMFPPRLLKQLLGDEEFERWESLTLEKALESMTDIANCPRCKTPCIEEEDEHAQCPQCFFNFCTICCERRHVGVQCMTPEMKLLVLQERQNSPHVKEDQKRRERERINEILSVREMLRDAKQCPSCRMAISRTEGCNKMVCSNCGKFFCYRCEKLIDGYDHYRNGTCDLFPQEEIMRWQAQMNPRQVLGQIRAEMAGERQIRGERVAAVHGQLCPHCGQFNAKVSNNNHMFCWACQHHYCYLCRQTIRRSSKHFGPSRGCKQHTEG